MEELEKDMTPKLIGETWRKYPTETSKQLATFGLYECQYCGKEWECATQSIKTGHTKSCGCKPRELSTHGLVKNRFYKTWNHMRHRCNNPKDISYKYYGGRGIKVCKEWMDVATFIAWCEATHPNIEGVSLDRIDNDKGYSPENCRWADETTQNTNQRIRNTNTSGFAGVSWERVKAKWVAYICVNNINKKLGRFKTKEEAVLARDTYILENGLPHKLSGLIID